jgi:pyridoxine 5-phosphate synthase
MSDSSKVQNTRLSVNINKIATLRNARGGDIPDLLQAATRIQSFGGQGITVHPRPDERHITYQDVRELRPLVYREFNIEGYPSENFIKLVLDVKPEQVTLVPDPPNVITSNAGWDVLKNEQMLKEVIRLFSQAGIRTSLFMDTSEEGIHAAAQTGTNRIELYTEDYALRHKVIGEDAAIPYARAATLAHGLGLGINAGHDLDLSNLKDFNNIVPYLDEVSIGHALISDALYTGLSSTIAKYLACLNKVV